MITWNQLREFLNSLKESDSRLDDNVTIEDTTGEFYPIDDIFEIEDCDVLDKGHLYLRVLQ